MIIKQLGVGIRCLDLRKELEEIATEFPNLAVAMAELII